MQRSRRVEKKKKEKEIKNKSSFAQVDQNVGGTHGDGAHNEDADIHLHNRQHDTVRKEDVDSVEDGLEERREPCARHAGEKV